jgi:dimeric dUTPase (all-alpha-NTP-PPase superfamily)
MNRIARITVALTVPLALGVAAAAPASAYDCFNASRSSQGNTAAATSKNWYSVPEFLSFVGLTQDQIDAAMPVIEADPRVPDEFTVFFNWQHVSELAAKMRDDLATNGHGIDHSDDYGTPVFDAIFDDVMSVIAG